MNTAQPLLHQVHDGRSKEGKKPVLARHAGKGASSSRSGSHLVFYGKRALLLQLQPKFFKFRIIHGGFAFVVPVTFAIAQSNWRATATASKLSKRQPSSAAMNTVPYIKPATMNLISSRDMRITCEPWNSRSDLRSSNSSSVMSALLFTFHSAQHSRYNCSFSSKLKVCAAILQTGPSKGGRAHCQSRGRTFHMSCHATSRWGRGTGRAQGKGSTLTVKLRDLAVLLEVIPGRAPLLIVRAELGTQRRSARREPAGRRTDRRRRQALRCTLAAQATEGRHARRERRSMAGCEHRDKCRPVHRAQSRFSRGLIFQASRHSSQP